MVLTHNLYDFDALSLWFLCLSHLVLLHDLYNFHASSGTASLITHWPWSKLEYKLLCTLPCIQFC